MNKLREDFEKETGTTWINSQNEPDIDYVEWLEARAGHDWHFAHTNLARVYREIKKSLPTWKQTEKLDKISAKFLLKFDHEIRNEIEDLTQTIIEDIENE